MRSDYMKTTKLTFILRYILIVSVLAALLLGLTGCKKPKGPTPSTDGSTVTTEETGGTTENNTTENVNATENIQPSQDATGNTEETGATGATGATSSNCVHVLGSWEVEKASTCTTEGTRCKKCTLCKEKVEVEAIPTIMHTPGNWITDKAATCTAEGTQHQECTQCKEKLLIITVDKAPHKDDVVVKGYAATATKNGLTDGKKCSVCKEFTVPQYIIPATGSAGFGYAVNTDNKTCTIISLGTTTDIAVPSAIAGYTVTGIGEHAFEQKSNITKVILPATITNIGESAFAGCTALVDITFQGTTAQWNAITKESGWNTDTGTYTVHCINGTIAK